MKKEPYSQSLAGLLVVSGVFLLVFLFILSGNPVRGTLISDDHLAKIAGLVPGQSAYPSSSFILSGLGMTLCGVLIVGAAGILHITYRYLFFTLILSVSGILMTLKGFFSGSPDSIQSPLSLLWILVTSLGAVYGFFMVKRPLSWCSLIIGISSLFFLVLFLIQGTTVSPGFFRDTGDWTLLSGALLFWLACMGGYWMGNPDIATKIRRNG